MESQFLHIVCNAILDIAFQDINIKSTGMVADFIIAIGRRWSVYHGNEAQTRRLMYTGHIDIYECTSSTGADINLVKERGWWNYKL